MYDHSIFKGIGFVPSYIDNRCSIRKATEYIGELGAECVRLWHPFSFNMDAPDHLLARETDYMHEAIYELRRQGVRHIISLNHDWFTPCENGQPQFRGFALPHRDTKAYQDTLELLKLAWYTQAKEFSDVDGWETGNEMNHIPFCHASDAETRGEFTLEERADICTDFMFLTAAEIRKSKPDSVIVMPGMAPIGGNRIGVFAENVAVEYDGILRTLDRIYTNIESGQFGSTDPRAFFDKLCWHPYYAKQDNTGAWSLLCPDDEWVDINRSIYAVAEAHGDGNVGCYLSEYGFNDEGDPEKDNRLADYIISGLKLTHEKMPFVETVQVYRLFDYMNVPGVWDEYSLCDCHTPEIKKKAKYQMLKDYYHSL